MKRRYLIILFCFLSFLAADIAHAAPLLYRIQMMKQRRSGQPTQAEYEAHMRAQQQGQAQAPGGAPGAPAVPTYQEQVDARNKAIAQAILDAHKTSVTTDVPFGNQGDLSQSSQTTVTPVAQPAAAPAGPSDDVKETVDLSEVWKKLDTKSTVWALLIDDQSKILTVSEYIDRFSKQGVKISAPPLHYVQAIDQMSKDNPQMFDRPFGEMLQILAIVDYDFDNGMDKDILARKVLGDAGFEQNKKRITQMQQQAQQSTTANTPIN